MKILCFTISFISRYEQRRIVAYLDSVQARLASLRRLQSAAGEELRPFFGRSLLPSVLDRAFKGEL